MEPQSTNPERKKRMSSLAFYITLMSLLFPIDSNLEPNSSVSCSSLCGNNEVTVRYPFRFRFSPQKCGMEGYELDCENDQPVLYLASGRYYVLAINYDRYTIRVLDEGIQMGNNSSLPRHFLTTTILFEKSINYNLNWPKLSNVLIANIKCEKQVVLDHELKDIGLAIVRTLTTSPQSTLNVTSSDYATYILFGTYSLYGSYVKIPEGCGTETMHLTFGSSMKWIRRKSANTDDSSALFSRFHTELASGFELGWIPGYYDIRFEAIANLVGKFLGVIFVPRLFCGLMPNGSLEKFISNSEKGQSSLSYEQMYNISIGIARGIEYLHRGCDMQILHFDIKPHNILLDENFTPKISDFGLAKLYPIQNSIVSLTAARGTMGYMAPELFYKNIGGVSYKADVYSFGMLLMEMAGRRRNLNLNMETLSQIYFPSGKEIDMGEIRMDHEVEMVKKMVIVALWCIQLKPSDRPSMNNVVEMLEGGFELLHMPPKPFLTNYQ